MSKILYILFATALIVSQPLGVEALGMDMSKAQEPVFENLQEFTEYHVSKTFGAEHVSSFFNIIEKESRWNCEAQNPTSTAYGIGQFLNSTWSMTSYKKTNDCQIQVLAMIEYVKAVYQTPEKALTSWKIKNWY